MDRQLEVADDFLNDLIEIDLLPASLAAAAELERELRARVREQARLIGFPELLTRRARVQLREILHDEPHRELEQRVKERTAELSYALTQLRQFSAHAHSVREEERKRIAQELHDSTAQHLAAINLNLMALVGASNSIEQRSDLIAEIRRSLGAAMDELRIFTYLLYPQELAQRGRVGQAGLPERADQDRCFHVPLPSYVTFGASRGSMAR